MSLSYIWRDHPAKPEIALSVLMAHNSTGNRTFMYNNLIIDQAVNSEKSWVRRVVFIFYCDIFYTYELCCVYTYGDRTLSVNFINIMVLKSVYKLLLKKNFTGYTRCACKGRRYYKIQDTGIADLKIFNDLLQVNDVRFT